ncbi:MAG TPA: hypothetical protein VG387_11685 [Rhizomicrobium sp.]|nr:hypothetical protein [Rhizomicrobium sp.]
MKFLANISAWLGDWRIPIFYELYTAKAADVREALKEVVITLIFSLMPLWVGILIVNVVQLSNGTITFLDKFASSADLGILSASLLGSLIYTIFREYTPPSEVSGLSRFPSGLWFVTITIIACIIAATMYGFVYVAHNGQFYNIAGKAIGIVNAEVIAKLSWALLVVAIFLVTASATIRNSMESRARATTKLMSEDTSNYVQQFEAAQHAEAE